MGNESELEALQRELRGVQEMLALVLLVVGRPVAVSHELLAGDALSGKQIAVEEDVAKHLFVFSLEDV